MATRLANAGLAGAVRIGLAKTVSRPVASMIHDARTVVAGVPSPDAGDKLIS